VDDYYLHDKSEIWVVLTAETLYFSHAPTCNYFSHFPLIDRERYRW